MTFFFLFVCCVCSCTPQDASPTSSPRSHLPSVRTSNNKIPTFAGEEDDLGHHDLTHTLPTSSNNSSPAVQRKNKVRLAHSSDTPSKNMRISMPADGREETPKPKPKPLGRFRQVRQECGVTKGWKSDQGQVRQVQGDQGWGIGVQGD